MEKKKNKGIVALIIVLIIIILGLSGYIVYDKVLKVEKPAIKEEVKESDEEVKETDFYSISELLKNNYIEKIETTETDYIKISDGKVFVYSKDEEIFKEVNGVDGVPKYVAYKGICSDCSDTAYIVLNEEGNVYYGEAYLGLPKLKKVNSDAVVNIYKTVIYDQNKFYVETNSGDLIRVDKDGINLSNTFEKDFKYVDRVHKTCTSAWPVMFLDKDGKIYKTDETEIKYNGNSIIVEEVFANGCGTDVYYIISRDNKVYKYNDGKVVLYTEKLLDDYMIHYNDIMENGSVEIKFIYKDGTNETISDMFTSSTMYKRLNK